MEQLARNEGIVRLVGLGLIAIAAAFAWFFVWVPLSAGETRTIGGVGAKLFVFVPLGAVVGLTLLVGGGPALRACQPPRSRGQTAFVLTVIGVAALLTLAGYRWYSEQRTWITGDGAANAVLEFYRKRASIEFYGLPNEQQLAMLAEHLSDGLVAALKAARVEQARCVAKNPSDIPQWSQGDLFTSHFEGHSLLGVRPLARGVFELDFSYWRGNEHFAWRDRALMAREHGRWVLDDLWFRPPENTPSDGQAPASQSLRKTLAMRGC